MHDQHNDYPLATESIKPEGSTAAKLILNLSNKTKYVVQYKNLKLYDAEKLTYECPSKRKTG